MLLGILLLLSSCLQISVSIKRVYTLTAKRFASSDLQCYSTEISGSVHCSEGQRCGTSLGNATVPTSKCVDAGDCSVEKSYEKCLTDLIESGEICCCDSSDCNEIIVSDYGIAKNDQINNNGTEQLSTKDADEGQRNFSSMPAISVANVSGKELLRKNVSNMLATTETSSHGESSTDSTVLAASPTSTPPVMDYSEVDETTLERMSESALENPSALFSEASSLASDAVAESVNYGVETQTVDANLMIPAAESAPVGESESSTGSQLFEEIPPVSGPDSIATPQATTGYTQPKAGSFSLEEPLPLVEPEAVTEETSTVGPKSLQFESTTEVLQSEEQVYPLTELVSEAKPTFTVTTMETESLVETTLANEAELASTFQPDSPSDTPQPMEPEANPATEYSSAAETESSSSFPSAEESKSSNEPVTTEKNEVPSDESSVDVPSTAEPLSSMVTSSATESSTVRVVPLAAAAEALTNQHMEISQASEEPQEPEGNSTDGGNIFVPLCIVFFIALLNSAHNYF